ncbi:M15 family metallopeptidase [Oceanobacillus oncorhynchi]|uniref:M15 family metallopeptidase n=1 Tax=Oceanobacillus oncorhynchi TaxID=545501 RepID=UPI002117150A|nr:M15 family metallopeptidase [Oceanobacillus oncorhynchi]UUI41013.1 M15 family metallopeptidase [Oceanobacillus oncorhynchi]
MKAIKHFTLSWIAIILFIGLLFWLYEQTTPSYERVDGEETVSELHPVVQEAVDTLIDRADDIDIEVVITDGLRTEEEQESLYARGRENEEDIVTHARGGESYHNYGLAVDYAIRNHDGEVIWDIHYDGNNNGESDWFEVADIAKDLGFEWGGDFNSFTDYPHLQMTFGLSISELQQGYRPPGEGE